MPLKAAVLIAAAAFAGFARAQQPGKVSRGVENPQEAALLQSGLIQIKAARFADAEATFRKLAALQPEGYIGFLGVAQVFIAQNRPVDAIGFLREESRKTPARPDLHVMIGDLAVRTTQFALAVTEFTAALASLDFTAANTLHIPRGTARGALVSPDPASAAKDLQVRPELIEGALSVLTGIDTTPKGAAGIHLRLAEVYGFRQDNAACVVEWRKTAELLPHTGWLLGNLGFAEENAGNKVDALTAYRESVALLPNNPIVLNNFAYLLAETGGDLYEALRLARRANSLLPASMEILDTVGWIALKQGYIDDAVGDFRRALESDPGNKGYRDHFAAALEKRASGLSTDDELIAALKAPLEKGDNERLLVLVRKIGK